MEVTDVSAYAFSTSRRSLPYIDYLPEYISCNPSGQAVQRGVAAFIGYRIIPKDFEEIENKRWGLSRESLIEEVQKRQRDFLQSFREKSCLNLNGSAVYRTLSLRFINVPFTGEVQICLVAKVLGQNKMIVRPAVIELGREIYGLFSYDFHLIPLATKETFYESTGRRLLENARCPDDIVEIRRDEDLVYAGTTNAYLLSSWNPLPLRSEQVWRALAASNDRVMLAVTLQPTELSFMERFAILELAKAAAKTAERISFSFLQRKAERAAESLAEKVTGWETPFMLQLHLVASRGVPDYIVRTVGSMLKTEADVDASVRPYSVVQSKIPEEVRVVNRRLCTMTIEPRPSSMPDVDVARFPFLFGVREAQSVFRLPFLPKGGIPGLSFGSASYPNGGAGQIPLGV